jgi:hypothetical protein
MRLEANLLDYVKKCVQLLWIRRESDGSFLRIFCFNSKQWLTEDSAEISAQVELRSWIPGRGRGNFCVTRW